MTLQNPDIANKIPRTVYALAALTLVVFIVDAAVSIAAGTYLNLGTGVWLALARDAHDGVLYRPLWDGASYGGTRYLPMLFLPIAGLMRLGVDAVTAGVIVSMAGLVALVASVATLLVRLALPLRLIVLGTALVAAPYFVHQTAFAVRCEPVAAAFAVAGLALLTPFSNVSRRRMLIAAALFAAAFLTKITCVYAPAAAVVALALGGQRRRALELAGFTAVAAAIGLMAIHVASGGRALESFRACALAGSSLWSLLAPSAVLRPLTLIATSHIMTVVFALALFAIAATRSAWRQLPALYLMAASVVTVIIFTSPGTILTSQILDAYVAAIVVLAVTAASAGASRLRTVTYAALVVLTVWTAGQNVRRIAGMVGEGAVSAGDLSRREIAAAVKDCGGSIVSESPLTPLLAGQRPVVLDPFAFHVVALNRPDIGTDLEARIQRREFACVVLEQDPATDRGYAWYSNVNLTGPVRDAVMQHYVFDREIAGQRFYRAAR